MNTNEDMNLMIAKKTANNIDKYKKADYYTLTKRLQELDKEWDTERVLETTAATVILTSALLGLYKNKKWFALTCAASLSLLQHAIQGWCPPLPLIRRAGVRTADEINEEKICLKHFRGDLGSEV